MVRVNIWLPKHVNNQKFVGHASLLVGDHTYISWWPDEPAGPGKDYYPIRNKTYKSDVGDEGGPPDEVVDLYGLDEGAIVNWWEGYGLMRENKPLEGPLPPYNLISQNCSNAVVTALKVAGGDKHANWLDSWSTIWRPQTVFNYASSIRRGMENKSPALPKAKL